MKHQLSVQASKISAPSFPAGPTAPLRFLREQLQEGALSHAPSSGLGATSRGFSARVARTRPPAGCLWSARVCVCSGWGVCVCVRSTWAVCVCVCVLGWGSYSSLRSSRCSRSRSLKQPNEAMLSRTSGSSSPFDGRLRMATRRPGAGSRHGSGSCFPPLRKRRNMGNPGLRVRGPQPSTCVLLPQDPEIRIPSLPHSGTSASRHVAGAPALGTLDIWAPLPSSPRYPGAYSQVPGMFLNLLQL